MKPMSGILAIVFLLFASGCEEQIEEIERVREERVEKVKKVEQERNAWEDAGEASLDLTEKLDRDLSYEEVIEIFGYEGNLKMNLAGAGGERKVYEWRLDGGVNVRVTFDDGAVTKWDVR